MVKRIGSAAWKTQVSPDGKVFSLAVRSDAGLEYEIMLGTVDSSAIVSDLLATMAEKYAGKPPRNFKPGEGPNHPLSRVLEPLRQTVEVLDGQEVLSLDFGGTVLRIKLQPGLLKSALQDEAGA
jgi:hypothetical protein